MSRYFVPRYMSIGRRNTASPVTVIVFHSLSMPSGIVVNQVRSKEDRELGVQIRLIGKRYFGLDAPFLGAIEYDDCVWQSIRHRKPVILDYPHSRPSRSIRQITETMLSLSRRRT